MENGAKLERNKDVYRRYIESLNTQDLDYAAVEDGRIVELRQSDILSQMRQMYGGTAKKAGLLIAGGLLAGSVLFSATRRLARRA
ncbi:MAG: hypothetical protein H0V21_00450 [Rubrobacter sp.]|nr:hypothetical protein [Rubrobacter sp.]